MAVSLSLSHVIVQKLEISSIYGSKIMKDFFNEKYAIKKRSFSFNSSLKTLKKKFHFELKRKLLHLKY